MSESGRKQEALQALNELQRYLGDQIAPLMAADSMEFLLGVAPEHSAAAVRGWLESQSGDAPVSDYIYHAIKKLQLFAEFQLVEVARFEQYLTGVARCLIPLCPPEERNALKLRLSHIGQAETTLSAPVRYLHRELGSEEEEQQWREQEARQSAEKQADEEEGRSQARRFRSLVDRLGHVAAGNEREQEELLPHLLTAAAVESRGRTDFEAMVGDLRERGIDAKIEQVFRQLASRLPGWTVRGDDGQEDTVADPGRMVRAMHRIVEMAGSVEESGKRFGEMVYAAIEQFNDGHLAQAVAMLDVATRLVEERKVDAGIAKAVRERSQGSVSLNPMRRFASQPSKHGLLRRVLRFFPAFNERGLLDRLEGEKKRDVRRLLLSLIEVHGTPCRPVVMERLLAASVGDFADQDGFYRRNLVYLLRRIPPSDEADPDHELSVLSDLIEPGQPLLLIKEAIAALGGFPDGRAEGILIDRLREIEQQLIRGGGVYTAEECDALLDRICASLGRIGTRASVRAVVRHAYAPDRKALGDTFSRLESLSVCDLSADPTTLSAVLKTLESLLPKRVLRMSFGGDETAIIDHVRALAATRAPQVLTMLQRLTHDFGNRPFAQAAAEVLEKLRSEGGSSGKTGAAKDPEGLKGDLELFGLPVLLQSLADSKATGELVIEDGRGRTRSTLALASGNIVACRTGRLEGLDAVCQLLEQPQPGNFRFDGAKRAAGGPGQPLGVLPTLMEGLRRHDEFQEARALVPDGSVLSPTGVEPPPLPDGHDADLARAVWQQAAGGTPPETCESAVRRDSHTVRRLYAWWLEQGALKRAANG